VLGHKEAAGEAEQQIIMLAFSGFIDFVRRFADLDPKILEFFLQDARMWQGLSDQQSLSGQKFLCQGH
jgi:hypothetical protein